MTKAVDEGFPAPRSDLHGCVLTIGMYDGVHTGHRVLLRRLLREAKRLDAPAVVVTFHPHPRCIVGPKQCPPSLTTPVQRESILRGLGVNDVFTLHFTEAVSRWSAAQFCQGIVHSYAPRLVVEGAGFRFGHNRQGDADFLRTYGSEHGFSFIEVAPVVRGGARVSSGRIREALASGRISEATRLLQRPYSIPGSIDGGNGPVVIEPESGACLPAPGAYEGQLYWGEDSHRALLHVQDGGPISALLEEPPDQPLRDTQTARVDVVFTRRLRRRERRRDS